MMKIEDILLKKEELPILNETYFQIPIHPKLLEISTTINTNIAKNMFEMAADEWYDDLKEYAAIVEEKPGNVGESTKKWLERVYLKEKPKITEKYGMQTIESLGWESGVLVQTNGFARSLSISRDFGGTLYYNPSFSQMSGTAFVPLEDSETIKFSEEKIKEFSYRIYHDNQLKGGEMHVYNDHNIDNYPGALFLRNWAILYLNEAMKQVLK